MESKNYIEVFKESFPDAKELTNKQRKNLLEMLGRALVEVRSLGWEGKSEQAADLADAFHNLPYWLDLEVFSFNHFRSYLQSYCQKHSCYGYFNYLHLLDLIAKNEDLNKYGLEN